MISEYEQQRDHFETMFQEICLGNTDAVHVCWSVFQFLHVIDDLVDKDKLVSPAAVGISLLMFTEAVSANPFFQQNRDALLGVLRVGVMEWVDSESWKVREDPRERAAAEVIKSGYQNVFYTVAGLCGGLVHMQAMTTKYRQFQFDEL